ncbi:hypothetical protein Scep_013147 [Stephania cephalantha]|uniref:Uncharacterized protein n=1 Tax=Stephania cephalantha TaxID=152367 RepID=A0AAP0JGG5_9MAGN
MLQLGLPFFTPNLQSKNFSHIKCSAIPKSDPKIHQYYKKNIWAPEFVQSLKSEFKEEAYCTIIEKLKNEVRDRFDDVDNDKAAHFSDKLELIDVLERLGLAYHFEDEIEEALSSSLNIKHSALLIVSNSLHSTSLYFRLLREHGHVVPTDVFNGFKDGKGRFKAEFCNDAKGMLSLYEASHLCFEGEEDMMHEAKAFTVNNLKLLNRNIGSMFIDEAPHALELPLHWRMPRLENRWYIDECLRKRKIDTSLLEFAELDFNMVQATHQKDLTRMSRWWEDLGISKVLSFTRDRLVECFLWSIGLTYEPQYNCCREWLTKAVNLIVVIDDIYDMYGSIDELELFTNTVERWSIDQAIEKLPHYMKISFLALYNTTNEMAELERGDVPSAVQCYMNKTKLSEHEAKANIRGLVMDTWGKDSVAEDRFMKLLVKKI